MTPPMTPPKTPLNRQGIAASSRARWLAELDHALHESERLADHLSKQPEHAEELARLKANIARLRAEVEQLRRGMAMSGEKLNSKRSKMPVKGPQTPSGKSPPPEKG